MAYESTPCGRVGSGSRAPARFDEADVPLDVLWLDIEYAEEHKNFVWDRRNFPTPEKMQQQLAERGRKVRSRSPAAAPSYVYPMYR